MQNQGDRVSAHYAKLTAARVTQIMNLRSLAPDLQEEIFFLRL